MKSLLPVFLIFIFSACVPAQESPGDTRSALLLDKGVQSHKGIDDVYRQFSEGYKRLDPKMVADLYTESAAYLALGNNIDIGRPKILGSFTSFFDSVRARKGRIDISFQILQREVDRGLGYDVGIYTLTSSNEKGESRSSRGKFIVVAKKDASGAWRFQVDGYSDMPREQTN